MGEQIVSRARWWGWPQEYRDQWEAWLVDHGFELDEIADFVTSEDVVVRRYLKDADGKRFLVGEVVASEVVVVDAKTSQPSVPW